MRKLLITGATGGIGFETAKIIVAKVHHLLIHGRRAEKLKTLEQVLLDINPNAVLESYCADLSKFNEVNLSKSSEKTH